jgi:FHA domain
MPESPLAPHASTPAELKQRQDALRTGVPHLVLRDGDGRQVLIALDGSRERLSIGRRPENDVALPWDERASRLHAELECAGGEWVLVDEGLSSNGTFVGEAKLVGRRRLRNGDVVRVGGTLIAYCAPDEPVGTTRADDSHGSLSISPAQRRVLVALCRPALVGGRFAAPPSNADLATALFLSIDSVKTHMKALFEAFELDDVPQSQKRSTLVERSLRLGVVTERDVA